MNTIEKLLAVDPQKLRETETKELEIKRLSKLIGEPFMVKVGAIDGERYSELIAVAVNEKTGKADLSKSYEAQTQIVVAGVIEPDLKDKDLQKHFDARTPKDLAKALFKGGDMVKVSDAISKLSGYGEESDEEIKN